MSWQAAETGGNIAGQDRSLSLEWQLLLRCAAPSRTTAEELQVQHLVETASLNWMQLTRQACDHGVAPLLFHTLQRLQLTKHLPSAARDRLASVYYRNAARNTLLFRMTHDVVEGLQSQGIGVIALKGAGLADTVYPNRAVRPMSDVDLLVRREAVTRAADVLGQLGYTCQDDPRRPHDWWLTQHYHLTWHPPASAPLAAPLELHWHLERPSRPFAIDVDGLWSRAVPAQLDGLDIRVLVPEDLLLHLCLHLCKHAGAHRKGARLDLRLRAFCDLAFILHQYAGRLDWTALGERAHTWGLTSYVALPLQMTRMLWGLEPQAQVADILMPEGSDPRLLGWLYDELVEDPEQSRLLPDVLRLWRGPGVAERLAVLRQILNPTVVARRSGLPITTFHSYGYYPARLWHLVQRYGPLYWRFMCHDAALVGAAERKAQLVTWLHPFTTRHQPPAPEV